MFTTVSMELLAGFWESLKVFGLTLLFSIPLGLVVCFGSMSKFKPLRWLVKTFVWWQNWSDYHRWYPESLMKVDFNFCSVLLSNLGSIGCDACYHHLNNFGTNSIVVTIGKTHQKTVVQPDGSVETRDMCNFAFTIDERIADGFYFARSIRLFDRIIQHPELLDAPIKEDLPDELR